MKSIGAVAVLHPQDSLNSHPDNLLPTPHKSHRTIKFNHSYTISSSSTSTSTSTSSSSSSSRRRKKNNRSSETASSKHAGGEFFAGSAFVESPPPSSVPIPGFFIKGFGSAGRDDPTTELRRILGLNLS